MTFHIIIQQERRTQPARMAQAISGTVQQGEEFIAGPEQLHHMGTLPEMLDDPQFVMVAEWDGQSPYVICHKGDYSARTMEYAGWPDLTETQWAALQNSTEGFL